MNSPNLFDRLEGYARENFTTETLAYILQTNIRLRADLMRLIGKQNRELKGFGDFTIETQDGYDLGRPDMVLIPRRKDKKKIFIEVKTQAQEGKDQLWRYLKLGGYVAYLTPPGFPAHSKTDKQPDFLGHFFWHDVYRIIESATPKSILNEQFLDYLEARNMGPIKPITSKELRSAEHAIGFLKKSEALVDHVRQEIWREWKNEFGTNFGAKGVTNDTEDGGIHNWWFRTKRWEKSRSRLYLCIGTCLEGNRKQKAYFYVGFGSSRKLFVRRLQRSLAKMLHKLSKCGWKETDESGFEWGYYKYFSLKTGDVEHASRLHAKHARKAVSDLTRLGVLKRIVKRT